MVETVPDPNANLTEFLAARARRTSHHRLTVDALGGLLAATAVALWRGPAWYILVSVAICFFAFGLWGIVDRNLDEHSSESRSLVISLRAARTIVTILGFGAAVFIVMRALGIALGSIES